MSKHFFQITRELSGTFDSIYDCLLNGIPINDSNGSPPDLMSKSCFQATQLAAFLTLLPEMLRDLDIAGETTSHLLPALLCGSIEN